MYHEGKSDELVRINRLIEAYEREHEQKLRDAGEPVQRAFIYSSAPAGEASRKFIFGNGQVVGIDQALARIRMVADMYKIDWRANVGGTCGQRWVAEIALCPRCGKDGAAHAYIVGEA